MINDRTKEEGHNYGSLSADNNHVERVNQVKKCNSDVGVNRMSVVSSREAVKSLNPMPVVHICAILSSAFSYGCIMSTLFLLTLPVECVRFSNDGNSSLILGLFAALAGLAQLVTPVVGKISDIYHRQKQEEGINNDNTSSKRRQGRLPYVIVGSICMVLGIFGQFVFRGNDNVISDNSTMSTIMLILYTCSFMMNMIGINIVYCIMIALIPDLVPKEQTGLANGSLAFQLVIGSLFGFGIYNWMNSVAWMYFLYIFVTVSSAIFTYIIAHPREHFLQTQLIEHDSETSTLISKHTIYDDYVDMNTGTNEMKKNLLKYLSIKGWIDELFINPLRETSWKEIKEAFTIDKKVYHDFYIVTISRLFYYMGVSSQTFFLYYIHDRIIAQQQQQQPSNASQPNETSAMSMVSTLAILAQIYGATTCIPVGILSDRYFHGRRKPFVYISCFLLAFSYISIVTTTTFHQMMICIMIGGAANGMYLTMDTSLAVDTLSTINDDDNDDGIVGHPQNSDMTGNAQLLGVWGVAGFLGTTLGPLVFGPVLFIFGHIPKSEHSFAHYKLNGYILLYSISAIYFVISAYSLTFVRKRGV